MKIQTAIVVDDSKSARFALRRMLESQQIKVQAVEDAKSCYGLVAADKPDVVFIDHVMPGISGLDAIKHLRSNPDTAQLPIVLCSSHDAADFVAEVRSAGATDVLIKPPSVEQLETVLRRIEQTATRAAAAAATEVRPAIGQRVFAALRDTLGTTPRKEPAADLGLQIEELRAQASRLQERLAPTVNDSQAFLQQLLQRMDALEHQFEKRLGDMQAQLNVGLNQQLEKRLSDMQAQLDAGLHQQSERLLRVTEAARTAAAESAHAEAEQTALQAAGHISDQFVSSLIAALRSGSFRPLLASTPTRTTPRETTGHPPA